MKQIENYEELSKLIFAHLKKNVITNQFISKGELEREIEFKKLYYIEMPNNLFILRDRGVFYVLNYYINELNAEEIKACFKQEFDKTVVVEVVGRNIKEVGYQKAIELFDSVGMKKTVERERFIKKELNEKKENINNAVDVYENDALKIDNAVETSKNKKIKIEIAENNDADEILELLFENFDIYHGCIPTKEQLKIDIEAHNIYKAILNGKIIGVLHISKVLKKVKQHTEKDLRQEANQSMTIEQCEFSSAEIRHLAVKEEYRNLGIATNLLLKYDNEVRANNKLVWTGLDNFKAQRTYLKNDYSKDGYVSTVFENYVYKASER